MVKRSLEGREERTPGGRFVGKSVVWPEDADLDSAEGILAFQKVVLRWLATGEIGTRQGGSILKGIETRLRFLLSAQKMAEMEHFFERAQAAIAKLDAEDKAKFTDT